MEKIAKAFLVMCLALGISIYMEAQVINVNVTGVAELHAGNYQFGDIQWQLSYDGYEYEDIENATDTVYSFVPEGNFYYRARISYGDCPDDYSQVCHVLVSPEGTINGLFSVGDKKKVYFSQGNLQYKGSATTPYWMFAKRQWEYLGDNGQEIDGSPTVDRDLFCWGTSGYNHGAVKYRPWDFCDTGAHLEYYYAYGNPDKSLFDETGKADWGYNAIANGGNKENQWRTMKWDEFDYLVNVRDTPSGIRYAKGMVDGVRGLILLPDYWRDDYHHLNSTNNPHAYFDTNIITAYEWYHCFESHGAVFLPCSGGRYFDGYTTGYGGEGDYWFSNKGNDMWWSAYAIQFFRENLVMVDYIDRSWGYAVRLVLDYVVE